MCGEGCLGVSRNLKGRMSSPLHTALKDLINISSQEGETPSNRRKGEWAKEKKGDRPLICLTYPRMTQKNDGLPVG